MEDMFLFSHKGDVPSCMSVFEGVEINIHISFGFYFHTGSM